MIQDEAFAVAKQWLFGYDSSLNLIEPPLENHLFDGIDPNDYFIFSYGSKSDPPALAGFSLVGINKDNGRIRYLGKHCRQ